MAVIRQETGVLFRSNSLFVNGRTGSSSDGSAAIMAAMAKAATRGQAFPAGWTELAFVAVAGLYLGLLGPFGNYISGDTPTRLLYWAGQLVFASLLLAALTGGRQPLGRKGRVQAIVNAVVAVTLVTLIVAVASHLIASRLWPVVQTIPAWEWCLQVLLIVAPLWAVQTARRSLQRRAQPQATRQAQVDAREEIVCVGMEDHYVRVYGPSGSRLVYDTMRAMLETLAKHDGLQVHRSWWVSRAAVEELIIDGRNVRLRLCNGLIVPVARSRIAQLRSSGWLPSDRGTAEHVIHTRRLSGDCAVFE